MNESYEYWLKEAGAYKISLDSALEREDEKDIIYYRGKYLYALKQAYKIDNEGLVPSHVTNKESSTPIKAEIQSQLNEHQKCINSAIKSAKKSSDIKNPISSIPAEIGLKIRRLSTRASQVSFKSGKAKKINVAMDTAGLVGTTLVKAPIMVSAKVLSKIGPLAITIASLPLTVVATLLAVTIYSTSDDKNIKKQLPELYVNTPIHQLSNCLKDAVKELSNITYKGIGKI